MTKKEIIEKLEEEFGMEVILHTKGEYSYKTLHKFINDCMDRLLESENAYVYMFSSALVVDDKSISGEPTDLWIKFIL